MYNKLEAKVFLKVCQDNPDVERIIVPRLFDNTEAPSTIVFCMKDDINVDLYAEVCKFFGDTTKVIFANRERVSVYLTPDMRILE